MKTLIAVLLALTASICAAQTTIAPGGAIYDNTNGVFVGFVNRNTGAEERIGRRVLQSTAPTCSTNCGTSPSIAGSDMSMVVTMGATGVPASGWVVTFAVPWPVAPSCVAMNALTTMVIGKLPIAVQTSTTTITVTTNGTAPANADKYAILCGGVS